MDEGETDRQHSGKGNHLNRKKPHNPTYVIQRLCNQ